MLPTSASLCCKSASFLHALSCCRVIELLPCDWLRSSLLLKAIEPDLFYQINWPVGDQQTQLSQKFVKLHLNTLARLKWKFEKNRTNTSDGRSNKHLQYSEQPDWEWTGAGVGYFRFLSIKSWYLIGSWIQPQTLRVYFVKNICSML